MQIKYKKNTRRGKKNRETWMDNRSLLFSISFLSIEADGQRKSFGPSTILLYSCPLNSTWYLYFETSWRWLFVLGCPSIHLKQTMILYPSLPVCPDWHLLNLLPEPLFYLSIYDIYLFLYNNIIVEIASFFLFVPMDIFKAKGKSARPAGSFST